MKQTGKYIYGVINSGRQEIFELDDIENLEDLYPFADNTNVFEKSRHAYTISYEDISAVVVDSPIIEYSHLPKDTLGKMLVRHQQVIEKIMSRYCVIPMRLGTFAGNNDEVRKILAKGHETIKNIFEKSKNSIEIDVAVTTNDFKSFLQEVSQEEEIKLFKESLLTKPGGVTIDDQIKIGVLVKKHLDAKKEKLSSAIQSALGKTAQAVKSHDVMDDKMVLNCAFLLDINNQNELMQKIEHLNDEFQNKLDFRCIGPLPPYSFYTLEVKKTRFDEVRWAKEKLGLEVDFITPAEIKKAHRRAALVCHPDKNPNTPDIERKFDEMTKAYKILLDYYKASGRDKQEEICYLNREAFEKNAVLVETIA